MTTHQLTRRTFTARAAGIAAGVFATSRFGVTAQDATAVAGVQPMGFVSTRIRTVGSVEQRDLVNERVTADFAPEVARLDGFLGYILGDVVDKPEDSLAIVVLREEEQFEAFGAVASGFVASLGDDGVAVETVEWAGDLLISGAPVADSGTPTATPVAASAGYVAVRVHTSLPGTDPHDFVPLATSGFLPIVTELPGFQGYLWYPTDGGFVAISLYDSEESAAASNDAAREWAAEFLTEYTDGNPEIINANVVYTDLPIFG